jgi:hypothetical protein
LTDQPVRFAARKRSVTSSVSSGSRSARACIPASASSSAMRSAV